MPVIFFLNVDFEDAAPAGNLSSAEMLDTIYHAQTHDELQKALGFLPQPTQSEPKSMPPPLREDRRLVIREGEEGGVLSQTEFKIASFASEYKLKKRASNSLIEMVTSRDFNPQDIQVSSIQQIEKLAMKANEPISRGAGSSMAAPIEPGLWAREARFLS